MSKVIPPLYIKCYAYVTINSQMISTLKYLTGKRGEVGDIIPLSELHPITCFDLENGTVLHRYGLTEDEHGQENNNHHCF